MNQPFNYALDYADYQRTDPANMQLHLHVAFHSTHRVITRNGRKLLILKCADREAMRLFFDRLRAVAPFAHMRYYFQNVASEWAEIPKKRQEHAA